MTALRARAAREWHARCNALEQPWTCTRLRVRNPRRSWWDRRDLPGASGGSGPLLPVDRRGADTSTRREGTGRSGPTTTAALVQGDAWFTSTGAGPRMRAGPDGTQGRDAVRRFELYGSGSRSEKIEYARSMKSVGQEVHPGHLGAHRGEAVGDEDPPRDRLPLRLRLAGAAGGAAGVCRGGRSLVGHAPGRGNPREP